MEDSLDLDKVYAEIKSGQNTFCKFLSTNDVFRKNSHQYGIYIPNKVAEKMFFDAQLQRGANLKKTIRIYWPEDCTTDSVVTYYGAAKNECRITSFGRKFPYLQEENTGDCFILTRISADEYRAWFLSAEDDIDEFLASFGMTPQDTNRIIDADFSADSVLMYEFKNYASSIGKKLPTAKEMSTVARDIYEKIFDHATLVQKKPDLKLTAWINAEYALFRELENNMYGDRLKNGFLDIEDFLGLAKSVLNSRKSRAGKSLENHLAAIFMGNNLQFEEQVVTEQNKRPDFVFPGAAAYHSPSFAAEKLTVLAAKTTCKDRWRQVINEADRVKTKYLCTLQQGISSAQMCEMAAEDVVLVIPKSNITTYPPEHRANILDIGTFIKIVQAKADI